MKIRRKENNERQKKDLKNKNNCWMTSGLVLSCDDGWMDG